MLYRGIWCVIGVYRGIVVYSVIIIIIYSKI